jgi:hypothetical protein
LRNVWFAVCDPRFGYLSHVVLRGVFELGESNVFDVWYHSFACRKLLRIEIIVRDLGSSRISTFDTQCFIVTS